MKDNGGTGKVPFFRSLRGKYAVTYLVVIAAVLALLNTYPVLATENMVMRQSKRTSLQGQMTVMASALTELEVLTADQVHRVLNVLGDAGLDRVLVTDPSGLILYDSSWKQEEEAGKEEAEERPAQYALFQEVAAALTGHDVFLSEYHDGVLTSCAAQPLMYRNVTIGAIYIHETDPEQGRLLQGLQANLRNISIITGIVVLILSLVFSRALTSRMGALLRAIRIVREGEYSHRVTLPGKDELSLLANEFSQLTDRLQTTEEARRRFVSDASHELKTPLASIRLLTDSILQSDQMDRETVQDFVSDIGTEAERLTRITEDLLVLTRMDGTPAGEHCHPVSVGEVADRVMKMLTPLARAVNVLLTCSCDPECLVNATEDGLYKILYNLAENAIKYNLPGGSVSMEAQLTDGDGVLKSGAAAGYVTIWVKDTGVGIPEEDRSKIFERFYRVDKARSRAAGGTGLGLAIVQDAVRQYQGWVSVAARTDGPGTEFVVRFPRSRKEAGEE